LAPSTRRRHRGEAAPQGVGGGRCEAAGAHRQRWAESGSALPAEQPGGGRGRRAITSAWRCEGAGRSVLQGKARLQKRRAVVECEPRRAWRRRPPGLVRPSGITAAGLGPDAGVTVDLGRSIRVDPAGDRLRGRARPRAV